MENNNNKEENTIENKENYFTKHWNLDHDFTKYNQTKQTVTAIGVLINKIYGWEIPKEIQKETNITRIFKKICQDINDEEKYDDLKTFIAVNLLDYYGIGDLEHYLIIGQILADKFIL